MPKTSMLAPETVTGAGFGAVVWSRCAPWGSVTSSGSGFAKNWPGWDCPS
ncbi:hypothetical protein ACFWM5_35040 [Streptomyces bobili]